MSEPIQSPTTTTVSEPTPARTFTQEEVDAIISKRLAKAMKGIPSEEELSAYRTWKGSQQIEQQQQAQRERDFSKAQSDLAAAQTELEQVKREKYVLSKGLTGDDAEFIAFKAAKLVDDKTTFEKAVDQLTENRQKVTFDWSAAVGGGSKEETVNSAMNQLIRGAFR